MSNGNLMVFTGTANPVLAQEVATHLGIELGLSLIHILIDRQGNSVTELAVAELMDSGEIKRHIRRTLKIYEERRNVLTQLLQNELGQYVSFDSPNGGLAIWLRLNEGIDVNALVKKALLEKVRILPAPMFSELPIDILSLIHI